MKMNKKVLFKVFVPFILVGLISGIGASVFGAGNKTIELWVGQPQAKVNGVTKWIDETNHKVVPIIYQDRTMLPARFIAENLDCNVDWNAKERKATVKQSESGELSGTITEAGSTSVLPLAEQFALAFMKKYPKVKITYTGGGSGAGIKQCADGTVNIGASSREIKMDEADLIPYPVARDGVAIVVNNSNSASNLTIEQIAKIFAGEITNWSQIGGKAGAITIYSREEGSGTRDCFEEKVMKAYGKNISPRAITKKSNGEMQMSVQGDQSGIAYVSLGYIEGLKALNVNGKKCSVETCRSGEYPIVRRLFFLTKGIPNSLLNAFLDFCRSSEGQNIVQKEGYVTLVK